MNKALVAPKKLCLLFTIVNKNKGEYFVDFLQNFDVNFQSVVYGKGTAPTNMINLLGLNDAKCIIMSVIKEDESKNIIYNLEEKFKKIKGGKGIAFTVPISSVVGVIVYKFLLNNMEA